MDVFMQFCHRALGPMGALLEVYTQSHWWRLGAPATRQWGPSMWGTFSGIYDSFLPEQNSQPPWMGVLRDLAEKFPSRASPLSPAAAQPQGAHCPLAQLGAA